MRVYGVYVPKIFAGPQTTARYNGKKCPLRTVAPDRDDYDKNALCAEMFQAKRFVELNKSTGWLVVLSSKKDVGGGWFAWFK